MFPRGAPGFALLILRVSVAAGIMLHAGGSGRPVAWMLVLISVLAATLAVGFLTPIAALFTIPVYLLETASLGVASAEALTSILQTIALSLLGPGSCSVDAYLYGRRVVVLPKKGDRDTN